MSTETRNQAYSRVQTYLSDEVTADARAYWQLLTDWPAILDWMREEGRPVPLVRVELEPGHQIGRVPCTRNCHFDTSLLPPGVVVPECVPETLLHCDPVARFLYYNMEGEGPFGMRNYLAMTEVDDLGKGRTRVTCRGRFDLPANAPADMVKQFIERVYDSIIHDIATTVSNG
jgi:hypothetical protein